MQNTILANILKKTFYMLTGNEVAKDWLEYPAKIYNQYHYQEYKRILKIWIN